MNLARSILFLALGCRLAAAEPDVTEITRVRSLSPDEMARAETVHVKGVVTWSDRAGQFTLQDSSAGIFVNTVEARRRGIWPSADLGGAAIHEGSSVDLVGVTDSGGYAPVILPRTLQVGPDQPLPPAQPMDPALFFRGAEAAQRIEIRGVPMGFERVAGGWRLQMAANPGVFTLEASFAALKDPAPLVDAEVRIDGVGGSGFNTRSELTNVRVLVGRATDIHIEKPAARSPFAAERVALDRLLPFSSHPTLPHRLLIEGTVTFAVPGQFFYLQEGNSAVQVESRSAGEVRAGDRVQAAGFVDMTRHVGRLLEATVRRIGTGAVPEAIRITPEAVTALNEAAIDRGQAAKPHDFDGHLIQFEAKLLSLQSSLGNGQVERTLILETKQTILSAVLQTGEAETIDKLQPGSELLVTGIVQLEYSRLVQARPFFRPSRLDVLLRSPADVAVLRAPSWWTAQRLLGVIAGGALALGSALLWVSQLRRQIRRKTQQLAAEMHARRDAAIEFEAALRERNRLAANLHDTLLQTMGGLGFQIQACEAEMATPAPGGAPGVHLEVAHKMLDHAVTELRDSVWALRSLPLHGLALPEALQSLADRAGAGHKARISVRTSGDLSQIPNFVAGNLLLAAQEAVHNALKHGRPATIVITAYADVKPGWIGVTVTDDGLGFVLGEQAGAKQGHFGLAGTRERIDRLAGTLRIQSTPGQGTRVEIEVPLRSYDQGMG